MTRNRDTIAMQLFELHVGYMQPEHRLGPALSLVGGAANFTIGEYILVRISDRIEVDGHFDQDTIAARTALPITSNGSSPFRVHTPSESHSR